MKPLTRYISLLLVGGLMLSFYYNYTYIIGDFCKVQSYVAKGQPVKATLQCESGGESFSFFKDVIFNIAPALKNLK